MTGARYDVIVVGGGDHGLVCAATLAKAGAKVALFEQKKIWDIAGNLRTPEFQGPYRFDLMPPYALAMAARAPCVAELGLAQRGLAFIHPPVVMAFHHTDDRALVFHRDPAKSAAAIARFCAADADHFLRLYAALEALCEQMLIPALFGADVEPVPDGFAAMSPAVLIDSYGFESPAVREALLYIATLWGLDPEQAGVGHAAILSLYSLLNASMIKSGNVAAANALYQCLLSDGGDCPVDVRVEQIVSEGGKAVGVRLTDGRTIRALAVVNACDARAPQAASLLSCHFGYRGGAPSYRAAPYDEAVEQAYIHVFGIEAAGDVAAVHTAIRNGEIPPGHGRAMWTTQIDPFHAGFGHAVGPLQTLRFDIPVPSNLAGGTWKDEHSASRETALAIWGRYTSSLIDGTTSYARTVTPDDLARTLPSFPDGAAVRRSGAIDFASGYIAAKRIASNLGIKITL